MKHAKTIYLTNVRWVTVLIVLLYHVCYMYNGVGIAGNIFGSTPIPFFDTLASIVYPWFMVLLFVVAGMDSWYALQSRSGKVFLKQRAIKLLVPSTVGLFVYQWLTGYQMMKINPEMAGISIPFPISWLINALSGTGPLWFVQMLFVFSVLLVLITKGNWAENFRKRCVHLPAWGIVLLVVPVWTSGLILNTPVLTMYRFGIYFMAFLIGYFIFSHESVQEKIEKIAPITLVAAVVCAVVYVICFHGMNFTTDAVLQNPLTCLYLWMAVLAVLGSFKRWFNRQTKFIEFMAGCSYGLYIVHYPVLLWLCILCAVTLHLPAWACYVIGFAGVIPLSLAVYEILRRIPLIRLLVLGISKKKVLHQTGA